MAKTLDERVDAIEEQAARIEAKLDEVIRRAGEDVDDIDQLAKLREMAEAGGVSPDGKCSAREEVHAEVASEMRELTTDELAAIRFVVASFLRTAQKAFEEGQESVRSGQAPLR